MLSVKVSRRPCCTAVYLEVADTSNCHAWADSLLPCVQEA